MNRAKTWLAALLVASAMGCGNSDNTNTGGATPGGGGGQPGTAGMTIIIPQGAASMGSNAFQPNPASVTPGMTVTWMNHDTMAHTATSDVGRFDSGTINPGQSWSWVVPQNSGTNQMDYHCTIHPSMHGSLMLR